MSWKPLRRRSKFWRSIVNSLLAFGFRSNSTLALINSQQTLFPKDNWIVMRL